MSSLFNCLLIVFYNHFSVIIVNIQHFFFNLGKPLKMYFQQKFSLFNRLILT